MPIREYECPFCGKVIERIEQVDDMPPNCEHENGSPHGVLTVPMVRVRYSRPARAQFKGAGFYDTDYKDKP